MQIAAAVCVPCRNEARLLPNLLDALAAQRGAGPFVLCLLYDGCSDASADVVAARSKQLPFRVITADIAAGAPNAGLARGRAMALGLDLLGDRPGAIIVSTDADSVPASNWLASNLAALEVADVAAGRIMREPGFPSPLQDRVEAYLDSLHMLRRKIDPLPWEAPATHHYTSGASLGFRLGAYRSLGGFDPLPSAEDARMVDTAHRAGLRVRHDDAIRVTTSARRVGRAVGGLADHLRDIDVGATVPMMADPDDVVWRYVRQAAARVAWDDIETGYPALAKLLDTDVDHVLAAAGRAVNAAAFAAIVVPEPPSGERLVMLDQAEQTLARLHGGPRMLAA
ncbi:glycosyltransferase [Sphingomonas sp. 1P06PA]|uniref:glycosyltransferase n=1 Tax=Sphingomonas sp. 1P06PA TaxID=554121 RepID=UPI0039A55B50